MIADLHHLRAEHNLAGLVAGIWGFLLGMALFNTVLIFAMFLLHASPLAICVLVGISTTSVAIGGTGLLCLEYVSPSIQTPREFFKIVGLTAKYALFMPLVMPAIGILLLTWRWIMWAFILIHVLPRVLRDFSGRGAYTAFARM